MIMKNYMEKNKLKKGNFSLFLRLFISVPCLMASHTPTRIFCFSFLFPSNKRSELSHHSTARSPVRHPGYIHRKNPTHNLPSTLAHFACLPLISFAFFTALPFFPLFYHFDAKKEKYKFFVCFAGFFLPLPLVVFARFFFFFASPRLQPTDIFLASPRKSH